MTCDHLFFNSTSLDAPVGSRHDGRFGSGCKTGVTHSAVMATTNGRTLALARTKSRSLTSTPGKGFAQVALKRRTFSTPALMTMGERPSQAITASLASLGDFGRSHQSRTCLP